MLHTDISNFKISSDMPTVIDVDSKITGDLEITTDVLVYGELIGSVKTEKKVVVGKGGCIRGDVHASNLEVYGLIDGKVLVQEQTILHNKSSVRGNIQTKVLTVQAGASFTGGLFIDENNAMSRLSQMTDKHTIEVINKDEALDTIEIISPVIDSAILLPLTEVVDFDTIPVESLTLYQSESEVDGNTLSHKQGHDIFRIYIKERKMEETAHVSVYSNLGEPIKCSTFMQSN